MPTEELVDVVDDNDRVIRTVPRSQMRREVLLHRVVAVLCTNSRGEIFVHRRTTTKDVFPGLYDMFAAGTVQAGEDYEITAVRELAEELGVSGVPIERLFHHLYQGTASRAHTEVYRVVWDGPIVTQASEIDWGEFRTREAILANREQFEFVPDGAELFARYVALY